MKGDEKMSPVIIVLFIGVLSLVLFATQKMPLGLVGILVAILLDVTKVLDNSSIYGNFASTTVIMFACLQVLGYALNKTSLVGRLSGLIRGYQGRERKVFIGVSSIAIVIALLTNASTATVVMLPIILLIAQDTHVSKSRLIKPSVDLASMWVGVLPIGMGLTSLAVNNGILEALGATERFDIFTYTKVALPISIVMTLYYWLFGFKLMPNTPNEEGSSATESGGPAQKLTDLDPKRDAATIAIFFGTVAVMVAATFIDGLETYLVALIGAMLLQVIGVFKGGEMLTKAVNWNVLLLVGGMSAFASALSASGAADAIGNFVNTVAGGQTNQVLLCLVFFGVPCLMTQVMNNVSTWQFMAAIEGACAVSLGLNPIPAVLCANLGAIMAVGLPSAFSGQAYIMEPGGYRIADYVRSFFPAFILYTALVCILVPILCPF